MSDEITDVVFQLSAAIHNKPTTPRLRVKHDGHSWHYRQQIGAKAQNFQTSDRSVLVSHPRESVTMALIRTLTRDRPNRIMTRRNRRTRNHGELGRDSVRVTSSILRAVADSLSRPWEIKLHPSGNTVTQSGFERTDWW